MHSSLSAYRTTQFTGMAKLFSCVALACWGSSLPTFEIEIISDQTVTFSDPNDPTNASFTYHDIDNFKRVHSISSSHVLEYRTCKLNYRQA